MHIKHKNESLLNKNNNNTRKKQQLYYTVKLKSYTKVGHTRRYNECKPSKINFKKISLSDNFVDKKSIKELYDKE